MGLCDKGNTVSIVEHKPDLIAIADHVVNMGPLAGSKGGQVVGEGSYEGLLSSGTLTGDHLQRHQPVELAPARLAKRRSSGTHGSTTSAI